MINFANCSYELKLNNKFKTIDLSRLRVKSLLIHGILLIVVGCTHFSYGQQNDTIDLVLTDTLNQDSAKPVQNNNYISPNATQVQMIYSCDDRKVMDAKNNLIHLYNNAYVEYGHVQLHAGKITIDANNSIVYAEGILDSNGVLVQTPVFSDNGVEYEANKMSYNTETGKGVIIEARTKQNTGSEDSYVTGEVIKKMDDKVAFVRNGVFTTCDHEHPHYAIVSKKLKMIQDEKIVTGPANLEIANVPTPLWLPFGFFPNSNNASSGIIFPGFGQDPRRGLFIEDLGYYIPVSNKMDQTFFVSYYTNNSYRIRSLTDYKVKYKYSGKLSFDYNSQVTGDSDFDQERTISQGLIWQHRQDPKMSTYSTFGADVNINANRNNKNDPNSDTDDYLTSNFLSNISYTHQFGDSPFNISLNARHQTNTNNNDLSIELPSGAFNMQRIFPFQRKNRIGEKRFYENIGVSYQNKFKANYNEISSDPFPSNFFDELELGMEQNISASTNFKLIKYLNFSPSYTLTETWYGSQTHNSWNEEKEGYDTTVYKGFNRFNSQRFALSTSTKVYGMYTYKSGKIKAIRHTMTPGITLSYSPTSKGSEQFTGMRFNPSDSTFDEYSYFNQYMYNTPYSGEVGTIAFSLQNSVEMKYQGKADTLDNGEYSKTSLIDGLNLNASYNFLADSLRWSNIGISFRNSAFQNRLTVNVGTTLSLYDFDEDGNQINTFLWESKEQLFFVNNVSFTSTFKINKESNSEYAQRVNDLYLNEEEKLMRDVYAQDYVDFSVPWDASLSYTMSYNRRSYYNPVSRSNAITLNGNISLTENFKIGYRTGFDFESGEMNFTEFKFYRDLHCWQMSLSTVPFGDRKRFTFNINVKSSMLKDALKWDMQRQDYP